MDDKCIGEYNICVDEYNMCVGEYNICVGEYNMCVGEYKMCVGWLVGWCLTSSEQFFSYIQDENI